MLKCNFVFRDPCLSTFSHDAVRILASPESIAGGAPNCNTGEFKSSLVVTFIQNSAQGVKFGGEPALNFCLGCFFLKKCKILISVNSETSCHAVHTLPLECLLEPLYMTKWIGKWLPLVYSGMSLLTGVLTRDPRLGVMASVSDDDEGAVFVFCASGEGSFDDVKATVSILCASEEDTSANVEGIVSVLCASEEGNFVDVEGAVSVLCASEGDSSVDVEGAVSFPCASFRWLASMWSLR